MGLLSGLFGDGGGGDRDKALNAVQNVPLPILKEYYPELYEQVVSMNPELETAVNLGPSKMAGVATDPALRAAQMKALDKLQGIGDAGGRDAEFEANMARIESDVNSNLAGQQGAIMQNLEMRGVGGGGNELVARQMNAQNSSNRQAQMAMDEKAQAERRALDAIMQSGNLAGNMQQQDFSQQSAKAQAQDAISKFNAANQQGVISNNVAAKNNAQQWNATTAQNSANQNTQTRNQAQQRNLDLNQQRYENEMARATGVANVYNSRADSKDRERDGEMNLVGGLIGAGAGAYGASKANNKYIKEP